MPNWACPTAEGDNYFVKAMRDPHFAQCLEKATNDIPQMVERMRNEYSDLQRDLKQI